MTDAWLCRLSAPPLAASRVVCFPYAGGRAALFRPWADALATSVDVCAVQLPGRDTRHRERPVSSVRAIVDAVVPALLAELDPPYALFGHSMGALVAFEVARALQARDMPAAHLLVSGRRAPHLPSREANIHALDNAAFVAETNRRYASIPAELLRHPDVMDLLVPVLRADMTAIETYVHAPGEILTCPITVFGGDTDPYASLAELQAWQQHSRLPIVTRLFTGGHFYFNEPAVLAALLAEVGSTLQPPVSRGDAHVPARPVAGDPRARGRQPGPGESFSRPS